MNLAYSRVVYAPITILYFVTSIALYRRKWCIVMYRRSLEVRLIDKHRAIVVVEVDVEPL